MAIPLLQIYKVARYLAARKLRGDKRYPLVLMLEPLFMCNLACSGCGKIDYPKEILQKRVSLEDALRAVDECGAPMVSIPGGEPLIHKEMPQIVAGIVARKKFVYLCTNAILLAKHIDEYKPSPYLTFSIHLDGNRERHDESVCQEGVFDKAVAAIQLAKDKGFRVTVNCTLFSGEDPEEVASFFDTAMGLGIEGHHSLSRLQLPPCAASGCVPRTHGEQAVVPRNIQPPQESPTGKAWSFNHSGLFLDFLAGNQTYQCTPWSNPTYNVFGWQRPCYLLSDEGYADTYKSLIEDTEWDKYGVGKNPRCDNCMAHCGFEGTAVNDAFSHPLKAMWASLRGPKVSGPLAPELPIQYTEEVRARYAGAGARETSVPLSQVTRTRRETEDSAAEPR
jgi:hopanoid biosynthesis associated radical SAM protein HpnH